MASRVSGRERRVPVAINEIYGAPQIKRRCPGVTKVGFAFAAPERALGKSAPPPHQAECAPPKSLKVVASDSAGAAASKSQVGAALPSRREEGSERKCVGHRDDLLAHDKFEYHLAFSKNAPIV